MFNPGIIMLVAMGPVAAYLAGAVIFSGVRALLHRRSESQPYSRRAFPAG